MRTIAVISVRSLLTETRISTNNKTPNGKSFRIISNLKMKYSSEQLPKLPRVKKNFDDYLYDINPILLF